MQTVLRIVLMVSIPILGILGALFSSMVNNDIRDASLSFWLFASLGFLIYSFKFGKKSTKMAGVSLFITSLALNIVDFFSIIENFRIWFPGIICYLVVYWILTLIWGED